jgi:hypothetical protein
MASMRIGPYKTLGRDVHTTWGTQQSPYITAPASAVTKPWVPPTVRGRHAYRAQPRDLSMLPADPARNEKLYDSDLRSRASLVTTAPPAAHGVGATDPQAETKVGMTVFLGLLGVASIAWLAFGAKPQGGKK